MIRALKMTADRMALCVLKGHDVQNRKPDIFLQGGRQDGKVFGYIVAILKVVSVRES